MVTGARARTALVTMGSALAVGIAAHTAANLRALRRPDPDAPASDERVSILVPARNEERTIETTVRSLLAQTGIDLELIVLDDGSTDATARILRTIDDPRLRVITGPDLPPPDGWLGKPWACARLAAEATGSVLVFADADVAFAPGALRAAVHELRTGEFALVAPYPHQLAESWLERLVQPLVTWSWVATMPLGWAERSTRPSLSAANGQFLVFDAEAYRAIVGHAAVQGNVIEDVGLMRALKRDGRRTATVDGSHLATCRMYTGTSGVVDGYAKSLWSAFNGPAGSVAVNALLLTAFTLPAVGMVLGPDARTRAIGTVGYGAGVASRAMVARRTGENVLPDALAQPASIVAFSALNIVSWVRHLRGANRWKGRTL